jgi:hypothetical protein
MVEVSPNFLRETAEFSFTPDDIVFVQSFHDSLLSIYKHVPEGPERDSQILQTTQNKQHELEAAEENGQSTASLSLVFFSHVMGMGPHNIDSDGAAIELAKNPLLNDDQREQIFNSAQLLWSQRKKNVPENSLVAGLRNHLEGEVTRTHSQGTPYEAALIGLVAGAAIGHQYSGHKARLIAIMGRHKR